MFRACALLMLLAWGSCPAGEPETARMPHKSALDAVLETKPFWISSASASAPLVGFGLVDRTPGAQGSACLVQGKLEKARLERYEFTQLPGLLTQPAGALVLRDRVGRLESRGNVSQALDQLRPYHAELRRLASDAIGGGKLKAGDLELMRSSVVSATGELVLRLAAYPTREGDPHGLYHHIDLVVFYDLAAHRVTRLHVFPVPLE